MMQCITAMQKNRINPFGNKRNARQCASERQRLSAFFAAYSVYAAGHVLCVPTVHEGTIHTAL